jgi:hypothetical protein
MMACRVEAQIRQDWDFGPGVHSLSFATKVNQGISMSINRVLRRRGEALTSGPDIGRSVSRIYALLWEGEYLGYDGKRKKVNGDISKISQIIGLSATEQALLQNYHFISTRISGTRQIRRSIRHLVFSSRIFYGVPVFITCTPSERHSGLAIHLHRGRVNDPAYTKLSEEELRCLSHEYPTLCPAASSTNDEVILDLPEYEVRRGITARDPLCCVHAFKVMTQVVLPALYGYRMCPDCPHCAMSECPCMDYFGSNATPMGGSAGRADAMIAAVEAQKAEGVLHVHGFYYFQCASQFLTLAELGHRLQEGMLSSAAMKEYISYSRCATYPDVEGFQHEREH